MSSATVYVDYPSRDQVASMMVGGMTVVERVLREAAESGAERAIIRGDAARLPALHHVPLAIEIIPTTAAVPSGAAPIAGDVVAGVRISDDDSRRAASRALFQACRRPYDGLGDRYIIRGVSLRITSVLCRLGVTPNQVTALNVIVGLVACGLALDGSFAIAGALMLVQVILDSCDGELARVRHLHSRFGMWLDNTSDDVIDNLFLALLGIGVGGVWAPIAIVAAGARSLSALMIHIDVARRGRPGDVMSFTWWFDRAGENLADRFETGTSLWGHLRAIGRRDLYVLVWGVACIAGAPEIGVAVGAPVALAYFGLAVAHTRASREHIGSPSGPGGPEVSAVSAVSAPSGAAPADTSRA